MRGVLLGVAASIAAITFPTAPAPAAPPSAQGSAGSGFSSSAFPQFTRSPTFFGDQGRHDRRRHRDFQGGIFYGDREYQGDTAWRPDGFNDWWHDRPERSYPAWMSRNQNCERLWWSGGGWRC